MRHLTNCQGQYMLHGLGRVHFIAAIIVCGQLQYTMNMHVYYRYYVSQAFCAIIQYFNDIHWQWTKDIRLHNVITIGIGTALGYQYSITFRAEVSMHLG